MSLKALARDEIVRLSQNSQVVSYFVGNDLNGIVVLWKLRFNSGLTETFHLAPAVAVDFAKGILAAAKHYAWPVTENWPDNLPELFPDDWDGSKQKFGTINGMRHELFNDVVVSVMQFDKAADLYKAVRFPPEYAVQIAQMHMDDIRNGKLRDIGAETPPSSTRN